jgi:Plasmid encoded RepA protein
LNQPSKACFLIEAKSDKQKIQAPYAKLDALIDASKQIANVSAKDSSGTVFVPRHLAKISLPHSKSNDSKYVITSGSMEMTLLTASSLGLPYGSIARLILIFLTTQAVFTKSPEIVFDGSFTSFMRNFGIRATGGRKGNISGFRNQLERILSTSIFTKYYGDVPISSLNTVVAEKTENWWSARHENGLYSRQLRVTIGNGLFKDIRTSAVPVDMRALRALKGSSLAIDIYIWLTHRMSNLKSIATRPIPWNRLQEQFGPGFQKDSKGLANFKKNFKQQLRMVRAVYPDAKVECSELGVVLRLSPTHVPKTYSRKAVDRESYPHMNCS